MSDALPLPIRILVKGASTVGWSSEKGGPRTDFTFPRAIEAELLAAGRPVEIRTRSIPSERTKSTLAAWEDEVIGFSPDVIVLVYGHYETIHLFLPWWAERHANSLRAKPRRLSALYRKRVVRPVWFFFAKLQARLDTKIDPTLRRGRPRNVAADLERLIGHVQDVSSPLVFVFELLPPARRYVSWFPGMPQRIAVMNEALSAMVGRIGKPNVRFFRTSRIVEEHAGGDIDVATPDGFHYSPRIHRIIGAELAREIMIWADGEEHLKLPG